MRILSVLGARPQFIKAGVLSRVFTKHGIDEIVLHTGQHFSANMSDVFFDELQIPTPNYNLGVSGGTHAVMTSKMMMGIEEVLLIEKPDFINLYGDTNSTLAGAIAASKLGIPIIHIEAGVRNYSFSMPEEINRVVTDRLSKYLFTTSEIPFNNLMKEGYGELDCVVENVGDLMLDSVYYYRSSLSHMSNKIVYCTIHRPENTDNYFKLLYIFKILDYININIAKVVLSVHPRLRQSIDKFRLNCNFETVEPMSYLNSLNNIQKSEFIVTDSGGLQREAFFLRKRCLTILDQPVWPEILEAGAAINIQLDLENLSDNHIVDYINDLYLINDCSFDVNLFGNGDAAERIAQRFV